MGLNIRGDGGEESSDEDKARRPVGRDGQGRRLAVSRDKTAPKLDFSDLDTAIGSPLHDSTWWCALVMVEVLVNIVVLGVETDRRCRHNCKPEDFTPWTTLNQVFAGLAIADVVVVMITAGPKTFFLGRPRVQDYPVDIFRCVDFLLVALFAIDAFALSSTGANTGIKYASLFRIMHLARFAGKVQLIGAFRELWLIIAGMADTMRTVVWVIALLLLILWLFAVVVTIVVEDSETKFNYTDSAWSQDDYWGSVPKSLYSLCQVLTLDTWANPLTWAIVEANSAVVLLFVVFLCIAVLALLNTIIGVVVESTLRSARENEEKEARERQKIDQKIMSSLEQIFRDADTDGNGLLEKQELHDALKVPRVKKAMQLLDLPLGDLDLLFNLLDDSGSGKIQTDQFFRGCTRVRGPAMARDLQHLSVDLDRHVKSASGHIDLLTGVNDSISGILDLLDTVDVEIVHDEADDKDPVLVARRQRGRGARSDALRKATKDFGSQDMLVSQSSLVSSHVPRAGAGHSIRSTAMSCVASEKPAPPPIPAHLARYVREREEEQVQKHRRFGDPRLDEQDQFKELRKYGNRGSTSAPDALALYPPETRVSMAQ